MNRINGPALVREKGHSMSKLVIGLTLLFAGVVWGQGYRISGNELVVNRSAHWSAWDFAAGTVEISSAGVVEPHFVRKNIDATRDILTHLRRYPPENKEASAVTLLDAVAAGTNVAAVANLFDGDESTYWEPNADRPLLDWWFEIDLGRLVSADRIVLKFAPEGEGDPFLQFVVLTSDGEGVKGLKARNYTRAFQTIRSNKDERVFEIELEPAQLNIDGTMHGDQIRFVQVVITDTDSTRGTEVSEAVHRGLAAPDVGDVAYYKKTDDGEVQVSKATHEAIDEALRAPVRYYRRERPRLVEIEVWTVGENISLGLAERRGMAIIKRAGSSAIHLFDGLFETSSFFASNVQVAELFFDLGAMYWLDTYQAYYNLDRSRLQSADVQLSDGTLAADGSLVWTTVVSFRARPIDPEAYDSFHFDPVRGRFVRILYWGQGAHFGGQGQHKPREMQFFGEGYQPEVVLTSNLVRLVGGERNLVSIEWEAETPPGTFVEIQTRTGSQTAEGYVYYNSGGAEVTAEQYESLGFFSKGPIDTLEVAGADWSPWSLPYAVSGAAITSPSPRPYLMMRVKLISEDPYATASLREIRLKFVEPLARRLVGEVAPKAVDELGVEQVVSVFIKLESQRGEFDEILLRSPATMALSFEQLLIGRESAWELGEIEALGPDQVQEMPTATPDSLRLRLAEPVEPGEADLLEVRFRTTLFTPGALLQASLGASSLVDSWQRVDVGDATALAAGSGMVLVSPPSGSRVLSPIEVASVVVTPNGDGINDELVFGFSVRRLTGPQEVEVRVYDLSGRQVWEHVEGRAQVSGAYSISWPGEGTDGQSVPPGVYVLAVSVDPDSDNGVGHTTAHRVIHVAY